MGPSIGMKRSCFCDQNPSWTVMRSVASKPSVGIWPRTPSLPPRPLPLDEQTLIVAHSEEDPSARDTARWICLALGPLASAGAGNVTKSVAIVAAVAMNAARTIFTIATERGA